MTTILAGSGFWNRFRATRFNYEFFYWRVDFGKSSNYNRRFYKSRKYSEKVVEIQTRATILKAIDGTKVIVPNSKFLRAKL